MPPRRHGACCHGGARLREQGWMESEPDTVGVVMEMGGAGVGGWRANGEPMRPGACFHRGLPHHFISKLPHFKIELQKKHADKFYFKLKNRHHRNLQNSFKNFYHPTCTPHEAYSHSIGFNLGRLLHCTVNCTFHLLVF